MTEIQQRYIDDDLHDQITTRYDVPDESETEKWSMNTGKSSCTKNLEEKLKQQRVDDPEKYASNYMQCPRCEKSFKNKRDTKKHVKRCRRDDAKYVKIKFGGSYPCQMCTRTNDTLEKFKRHVFYKH